jgi:hypothetical protein
MLFADDEHRYDPEVAEENRRLFIEHQTLINRPLIEDNSHR